MGIVLGKGGWEERVKRELAPFSIFEGDFRQQTQHKTFSLSQQLCGNFATPSIQNISIFSETVATRRLQLKNTSTFSQIL